MACVVALALGLSPVTSTAGEVSFERDVLPVLTRHCVMCHLPGDEQGELGLYPDAFGNLSGAASNQSALLRVQPGSAEQSYLYHKLIGSQASVGGSGVQMPYQRDPLEPGQLDLIRQWIDQGAKQN